MSNLNSMDTQHLENEPSSKKKKRVWLVPVLVGVAGMSLGFAAGGGEPETITETVEVEKEVIKEVEVPVETKVTNPACLTALDHADEGFRIVSNIFGDLSVYDFAAVENAHGPLENTMNLYVTSRAECRAGI